MKNYTFILLLVYICNQSAMEKPLEEQRYWATKKSHEKNPQRFKKSMRKKLI